MGLVCGDVGLGASGGDIYGQKMRGVTFLGQRDLLGKAGLSRWGSNVGARIEVNHLVQPMCHNPHVLPAR